MEKSKTPEHSIEMLQYRYDKKIDYYEAFLEAQKEFPEIPKNKSGARGFKYADLGSIFKVIVPVLNKHGITIEQDVTHKDCVMHVIVTKLTHSKTGQYTEFESLITCKDEDFNNKITSQVYGTSYTYFKRYALASKLCLYADEDTDGVIAQSTQYRGYSRASSQSSPGNKISF